MLIKPLPRLWTPRETFAPARCPRCRRPVRPRPRRILAPRVRPFWRGGVRALGMADGDVMLDDSGNVILDASGNVLLDDGAGCASCCSTTCTACQATPASVTFATVVRCFSCSSAGRIALTTATISGGFSLTLQAGPAGVDCFYGYSGAAPATVTYHELSDGSTCGGAVCDTCSTMTIQLGRTTATGKWSVAAQFGSPSSADIFQSDLFDPPGTDNYCWTKSVGNTLSCGVPAAACASEGAPGADGSIAYYHGGTATITVG